MFGRDPVRDEVAVKASLCYVPDQVAFYPWMTVGRHSTISPPSGPTGTWRWRGRCSTQFRLDPRQKTSHLSKGQRTQLALIVAICPEPELLVLDEPTSGLDPIVRREFIETIIGAYQDADPAVGPCSCRPT